jgi:hypothetical protein
MWKKMWCSLEVEGDALEIRYRHVLENLAGERGIAGRDLPQSAEQDSGLGQAAPPDRRLD